MRECWKRTLRALAVGAGLLGCASLEGARLYRDGSAALDRGQPAEAIELLERAALRVPQASEVQNHLGIAYAAAGRHDAALTAWRRAVELDCDNVAARRNLDAALRRMLEPGAGSARIRE